MTPQSAKQKGRKLQQRIAADLLLHVYAPAGLEGDDCKSVSMGVSGNDVVLSPAARKVLNLAIEAKNCETLNHTKVFWDQACSEGRKGLPLLVSKRNRTEPIVTMRWEDFVVMACELVALRAGK